MLVNIFQFLGIIGAGLTLASFYLVRTGKISPKSKEYAVLSFFACVLLLGNAIVQHALGSIVLNIAWIILIFAL